MQTVNIAHFRRYTLFVLLALLLLMPQVAHAQDEPLGQADIPAEASPEAWPDEVTVERTSDPNVIHTTRRIYVSEDSYLSSGFPNNNFGGSTNLNLGWQNGSQDAMRILIKFDIGAIPSNANIKSARVSIYQFSVVPNNDGNMDFEAQYMRQDWSEYSVNWNNANYLGGDPLPFGTFPPQFGYLSGDATNLVKSWVSGSHPNYGLLITGDETPSRDRSRLFYSRETGTPPYIDVEYDVQCDTIAPTAAVEPLSNFQLGTFLVKWYGQDTAPSGCTPSGIANFDVLYRVNGGNWVHWKDQTTSTENHFADFAPNGAFVELTARATDHAGNVGDYPPTQASTTIDSQAPTTAMTPLPEHMITNNFTIDWSGNDGNGSGVRSYNVQVRIDNGNWLSLIENTQQTSYHITGVQDNSTYDFRTQATDQVGNVGYWPDDPQASTTIIVEPVAKINPFVPSVLKPTAPITDTFNVSWVGVSDPGTTITEFSVFYSFNNGPMQPWEPPFPGTQLNADFPYKQMGYGDGVFAFNVKATDSTGRMGEFIAPEQSIAVDMADAIQPSSYLPAVVNQ